MAPTGVRLRFRLDDMLKAGFVDDDFIEHLSLAATVFRSRLPGAGRDPFPPCWGGRPPTASMCQNEVVAISNEGAVHGEAYPNWYGHVEASLSAAWCQRSRGAGASPEAAA